MPHIDNSNPASPSLKDRHDMPPDNTKAFSTPSFTKAFPNSASSVDCNHVRIPQVDYFT